MFLRDILIRFLNMFSEVNMNLLEVYLTRGCKKREKSWMAGGFLRVLFKAWIFYRSSLVNLSVNASQKGREVMASVLILSSCWFLTILTIFFFWVSMGLLCPMVIWYAVRIRSTKNSAAIFCTLKYFFIDLNSILFISSIFSRSFVWPQ